MNIRWFGKSAIQITVEGNEIICADLIDNKNINNDHRINQKEGKDGKVAAIAIRREVMDRLYLLWKAIQNGECRIDGETIYPKDIEVMKARGETCEACLNHKCYIDNEKGRIGIMCDIADARYNAVERGETCLSYKKTKELEMLIPTGATCFQCAKVLRDIYGNPFPKCKIMSEIDDITKPCNHWIDAAKLAEMGKGDCVQQIPKKCVHLFEVELDEDDDGFDTDRRFSLAEHRTGKVCGNCYYATQANKEYPNVRVVHCLIFGGIYVTEHTCNRWQPNDTYGSVKERSL